MAESVTALLFSPEELIQEEAANLIARSDSNLYFSASQRIPGTVKKRLDEILNGTIDKNELIFEKIQFLSRQFGSMEEDDLLLFATEMKYKTNFEIELFDFSGGVIVWQFGGDNVRNNVHIFYDGEIDRPTMMDHHEPNEPVFYLPLTAIEQYHFQFPDKSGEILKYIDSKEI